MRNLSYLILALSVALNVYLGFEYMQCKGSGTIPVTPPGVCTNLLKTTSDAELTTGREAMRQKLGYSETEMASHYGIVTIPDITAMVSENTGSDVMLIYPVYDAAKKCEKVVIRFANSTLNSTNCQDFRLALSSKLYTPSWCPDLCPK